MVIFELKIVLPTALEAVKAYAKTLYNLKLEQNAWVL